MHIHEFNEYSVDGSEDDKENQEFNKYGVNSAEYDKENKENKNSMEVKKRKQNSDDKMTTAKKKRSMKCVRCQLQK